MNAMPKTILRSRLLGALLALSCAISPSLSSGFGLASSVESRTLRKGDHARLAAEFAGGGKEVMVLIAARPGANPRLVREIERRGGQIRYREDGIDYIRANVPITKVTEIASLESVESINVGDDTIYFANASGTANASPRLSFVNENQTNQDSSIDVPGPHTPAENPFLPTMYAGAPQFVAKHPTFDGRGVVIAVIDGFPDILHPVFQSAKTLDGKPVPKLLDAKIAIDPVDFGFDTRFFVNMAQKVVTAGGRLSYQGKSYTAPAEGRYRIGTLAPRPGVRDYPLAALWDERTNTSWVDTDRNLSFADEKAMTDYHVRQDVGAIGQDDPATPIRENLAFTIQTYPKEHYIGLNLMNDTHGTMVASAAAGKSFFSGRMNGTAPEAQLLVLDQGSYTSAGLIEALIRAAKHPQVDLITTQAGLAGVVRDADSTVGTVCDRLVEKYRKPIFASANNHGPGLNTVTEAAIGNKVISVGSYVHRDTWRAVYGIKAGGEDYVAELSSRGPRDDGGFKPDILAPVGGTYADVQETNSILPGGHKLPPGYGGGSLGTSLAAPTAAGAAALLISAAKQSGIAYDAEKIRRALTSTAGFLPSYQAVEQGNGLINVRAAWEALKHAPTSIAISSRAPVKTAKSVHLRQPDLGRGIYEREGWAAGQSEQRAIIFTRTSGSAKPLTYALRWIGNNGTFSSAGHITLPLNTSVTLQVIVSPKTPGVHSAILEVVEPESSQPVYRMMNVVVAAEEFTTGNQHTVTLPGRTDWMGHQSYFFNVPAGTSAVKFEAEVSSGRMRMSFYDPNGTGDGYSLRGLYEVEAWPTQYRSEGKLGRTFVDPLPGVWEVVVQNETRGLKQPQSAASPPAAFTLTGSLYTVSATPSTVPLTTSQDEGGMTEISFTNSGAPFRGGISDGPLGSARSDKPLLKKGGFQVYEVEVAPGAKTLSASIGGSKDPEADLDLYAFNCSKKYQEFASWMHSEAPVLTGYSAGEGSEESVVIDNPQPGKWKVVIFAASVPSGRTSVAYQDIVTHPMYGMIKSTDVVAMHSSGERWTGRVQVQPGTSAPATGRYLAGLVEVTSEDVAINFTNRKPSWQSDSATALGWPVSLGTALVQFKEGSAR